MQQSLKQRTISGMIWNGIERFGSSLFLFISNLVLARLLSPSDFGAIGMLMVFISLSQAIIDGGFGSALIQKKEPTQTDYSTIFFWNIALSTALYIALYFASPAIARFYNMPSLTELLRVLGIVIVFNSLFLIQNNILKKSINFKKVAKINLIGIVIGTVLGIAAAYCGYGVWSLVIKTISTAVIQCALFWVTSKWRPQFVFCWHSFKSLFAFGGYMFLETFANTVYANVLSLTLGKLFSPATLGCFTQARKLKDIPQTTFVSIVNNVTFPVFSHIQDDRILIHKNMRKCIQFTSMISVPLMILLFWIAEPLFIVLFSDKWIEAVPLFKLLCIHGLIYSPFLINLNVIKSIGLGKEYLSIILFQSIIGIVFIMVLSIFGYYYAVLGYSLTPILTYFVAAYFIKKHIGYKFIEQINDQIKFLISTLIASIPVCFVIKLVRYDAIYMILMVSILFLVLYIITSYLINRSAIIQVRQLILHKK